MLHGILCMVTVCAHALHTVASQTRTFKHCGFIQKEENISLSLGNFKESQLFHKYDINNSLYEYLFITNTNEHGKTYSQKHDVDQRMLHGNTRQTTATTQFSPISVVIEDHLLQDVTITPDIRRLKTTKQSPYL